MAIGFFKQKAGSRVNRTRSGDLGVAIFLIMFAAVMAIPLYYAIIQSLKPVNELYIFPPRFYVVRPTTEHYADLFRLMANSWIPFSRYVFNTVLITAVGTFGHIIIASMAAYPLAKYKFPGSFAFSRMVRFSLMFDTAVLTIPSYIIMARLGWVDTYLSIIVPAFGRSLGLYLMQNFMGRCTIRSLTPRKIDGARERTIFWRSYAERQIRWLTLMIFFSPNPMEHEQ